MSGIWQDQHKAVSFPLRPALPLLAAVALLALLLLGLGRTAAAPDATVEGVVVDAEGAVAGATVRVRATDNVTTTDAEGRFLLGGLIEGQEVEITAWADGYYIASRHVTPTASGVTLTLRPYHTADHPEYEWVSPISGTSAGACGNCHPMVVSQWITNAHGGAVSNPRFFSLYNGTDISGTAQVGPGYLIDFPGTAGNCANCHAPGVGADGYLTTEMNGVRGVITAGIHCDYCHKVGGVYLDPATGSVYPNAPGAQSQRLLRPPPGDDIFFGPYDDIHDPDTYLPVIRGSAFCAPCHQFSFWGTPIYQSYGEWLESPYAEAGVTCQDCHMPPTGDAYFALPERGGLPHPPERIPSHLQVGATDETLLRNAVTMQVTARQRVDRIVVTVTLTNTGAGHDIPTDFPGRHLILTVTVVDGTGVPLAQTGGPVVPDWGGEQAGLPGRAFAKVLQDVRSGEAPVVSYWKPSRILEDNRIPALGSDTSTYTFALPRPSAAVTVTARLRFRRAFQGMMDAKGWDVPDVVMGDARVTLVGQPWWTCFLPVVMGGD